MEDKMLSIIVPIYNEEETLPIIMERIQSVEYPIPYEMVAVDDGSSDNSPQILQQLSDSIQNLRVITYPENKGKGYAIRTGFQEASGDIIIIQDADLEYDPAEIPKLIEPIFGEESKVVYGSRFAGTVEGAHPFFTFGNKFLTGSTNLLFGCKLTDMETCYKALDKEVIENMQLQQNQFGIEPEITANILKQGYTIKEIPISYAAREEGKKITWKDGLHAFLLLWKLRFS